jgi:hypothetical protein
LFFVETNLFDCFQDVLCRNFIDARHVIINSSMSYQELYYAQWTNFSVHRSMLNLKWEQNAGTKYLWHVYLGGFIAYQMVSNKLYVLKKGEYITNTL